MVLGIYRKNGQYLGVPIHTTMAQPGDRMVVYGEDDAIPALAARESGPAGGQAHHEAVVAYRRKRQKVKDAEPS